MSVIIYPVFSVKGNCIQIWGESNYQWDDADCYGEINFICEHLKVLPTTSTTTTTPTTTPTPTPTTTPTAAPTTSA